MTGKRDGHLEWQALLDFAREQGLPVAARTHVEGCARCAKALGEVELLVADMRSDQSREAPPELVRRLVGLFDGRPSRARRVLETVGGLIRGFQAPRLAAAGARSASAAPARLLFEAADYEIELELSPAPGGRRLMAQVDGPEGSEPPLLAWAEAEGRMLQETPVSGHGMFLLEGLPEGGFDLVIDTGDQHLRLPLSRSEQPPRSESTPPRSPTRGGRT